MASTDRATKRVHDKIDAAAAEEEAPVAGPSKFGREIESEDESGSADSDDDEGDFGDSAVEDEEDEDDDEDAEIRQANEDAQTRPKKKRKRALPSQAFGSLLSSLVAAPLPTKPLRPLHPPPSSEALERKALKALQASRHERQERGHVSDVIGGWTPRPNVPFSQWASLDEGYEGPQALGGAEKEKELRRLAQKGAVRLFNAIKAAQSTAEDAEAGTSATRTKTLKSEAAKRAIKEASPAGSVASNASKATEGSTVAADRKSANLLGSRGKQEALANLSKASFLELFKTGSGGGAFAKPKLSS